MLNFVISLKKNCVWFACSPHPRFGPEGFQVCGVGLGWRAAVRAGGKKAALLIIISVRDCRLVRIKTPRFKAGGIQSSFCRIGVTTMLRENEVKSTRFS